MYVHAQLTRLFEIMKEEYFCMNLNLWPMLNSALGNSTCISGACRLRSWVTLIPLPTSQTENGVMK